jgi:micrococcal nuclease
MLRKIHDHIVLLIVVIVALIVATFFTYPLKAAQSTAGVADIYVNGNLLTSKAQAGQGGHWLVSGTAFAAVLNARYSYNRNTKTISLQRGKLSFTCKVGATRALINGKTNLLPTTCQHVNGQSIVPLRPLAQALGATTGWQNHAQIITISTSPMVRTQVVKVIDGDTLEIRWNNRNERIRLIGVDTPETVHPRIGEEPYGREASNFTKSQLTGKQVLIELDVEPRDRYGRLLGYLYLTDGTFFNASLINQGFAQLMTYPPNVRWVSLYQALQTNARTQNRGLWGLPSEQVNVPDRTMPNNYNVKSGCANPLIKGNINSKKEKIYHVPGGDYYNITKPEQLFCNEQEALNAGFRKSRK